MRRCFPAISTMTIKTVRGSRPKMYQNQRKIFCFFLRGLRSEQGVDVFQPPAACPHADGVEYDRNLAGVCPQPGSAAGVKLVSVRRTGVQNKRIRARGYLVHLVSSLRHDGACAYTEQKVCAVVCGDRIGDAVYKRLFPPQIRDKPESFHIIFYTPRLVCIFPSAPFFSSANTRIPASTAPTTVEIRKGTT